MTGARILVVDDGPEVHALLRGVLERDGHEVSAAESGEMALDMILREGAPDVVLLDVGLPGIDGLETAIEIRKLADPMIIFLSARSEEIDRISGLVAGGDDYITKPFSPHEVSLRVKAVLRRRSGALQRTSEGDNPPALPVLRCGPLVMDLSMHTVNVDGDVKALTKIEFDVLKVLLENPRRVVKRQEVMDEVWGHGWYGSRNVLDVHVSSIRRKLGDDIASPKFIIAVRGVGYRLGLG